jgi:hypothetical protein
MEDSAEARLKGLSRLVKKAQRQGARLIGKRRRTGEMGYWSMGVLEYWVKRITPFTPPLQYPSLFVRWSEMIERNAVYESFSPAC